MGGNLKGGATHGAVTPVDVVKVRGGGNARARAGLRIRESLRVDATRCTRDAVNE